MAGGYAWSRRVGARVRTLRGLVHDTQRALHDVVDIITVDRNVMSFVQDIGQQAVRPTAIVVAGTTAGALARLVHCLLGRRLLPVCMPRGRRWIRIQYGNSTQVHLSLGNSEFELVEELECNKRAWEVLPVQDIIRQDDSDLTTILEVELNNQFLRDGLKIIIPPDIPTLPLSHNHLQLKFIHTELYQRRASILKSFNCVYLYALDKTGKNIFSDNVCGDLAVSKSDEDFWSSFSLYTGVKNSDSDKVTSDSGGGRVWSGGLGGESAVFTPENCLDLHQIKELNPHSQPLFILFSDSVECSESSASGSHQVQCECTESTGHSSHRCRWKSGESVQRCDDERQRLSEEQVVFMNDLMDQWELMTTPPQKHYIKCQWLILDDEELMGTVDLKHSPAYSSPAHAVAGETCAKGRKDDKFVKSRSNLLNTVVKFATDSVQSYLLEFCTRLSEVHIKLLQRFILASFDMARELQVVPKKIQYVAIHEQQLFETINEKFSEGEQKQELLEMMQEVLQEMKTDISNMDWCVDDLPCHQDRRFPVSGSTFYCSTVSSPSLPLSSFRSTEQAPSDGEEAASYDSYNLEEYDIIGANEESFSSCYTSQADDDSPISPPTDIRVENETEMFSLSSSSVAWTTRSDVTCCSRTGVSIKHATMDVQQTVLARLSRKISLKLVKFFDCLKESYFGTLQRCLESLESSCRQELGGKPASEAMRQLLSVGRQVELQPNAAFSLLRTLLDSLRRLFNKLRIVGGEDEEACCVLSPVWRRRVALQTAHSMSPHRLARIISTQIIERLSVAHEKYQSALAALESALASRLHHTEDIKLAIRKKYAPSFARLCLESTSMCDLLIHGTPELGREIGRGQYGVVYSVRGAWGGRSPVAVKSVLPSDERHYHELAMEFFYTRTIPVHPRIVQLYGSVVQRTSGNGRCVLLITDRKVRDLHAAVRSGLPQTVRMRIASDIVEGIRYLHSLGLVHRDIKLKNVLLDSENRASLSDLGFCAAGALISGSVVGTPVHMAPELLDGEYCAAVDVYAFGVLFWYLCAGDIKLPAAFENFNNKEQLWTKVKKGRRPERLPHFTDQCWSLMESCWHADPDQRPLLGDIQQQMQKILEHSMENENETYVKYDSSEDSLDMTGVDAYDCEQ